MSVLEDGKGRGYKAEVNSQQELVTRSIGETELEHASYLGNAWAWDSLEVDIDATDTMLFVKNTSDTPLVLDRAVISGSNVICEWTIHIGSDTTTPAGGTEVVAVNINTGNLGDTALSVARSDETSVADGSIIGRAKTPVDNSIEYNLDGIIIQKNHYIQFNQETESDSGSVVLYGHNSIPS
jgi:hypothetical protein